MPMYIPQPGTRLLLGSWRLRLSQQEWSAVHPLFGAWLLRLGLSAGSWKVAGLISSCMLGVVMPGYGVLQLATPGQ